MANKVDNKKRLEFAKQKFNNLIIKSLRKGKLIKVCHIEDTSNPFIVDAAFLYHNISLEQPNFLNEYINFFDITKDGIYVPNIDLADMLSFSAIIEKSCIKYVLKRFIDIDPTLTKEYVEWMINLYSRILKNRDNVSGMNVKLGDFDQLFFEDLPKLTESIAVFEKLKKSKILSDTQKDINSYKSVNELVSIVFVSSLTNEEEKINTELFYASELEYLNNSEANLLYQDNNWSIVQTLTYEANSVFGKGTTWCTASKKYGDSFGQYNSKGPLYVLIKNSRNRHSRSNPNDKLQFHFESNQFNDSLNNGVNLSVFLNENKGVKNYFRPVIINNVLSEKLNIKDIINKLTKYGFIDALIDILKTKNIVELDLSSIKIDAVELNRLYEITTLQSIIFDSSGLTEIPEGLRHIKTLKKLYLQNNYITKIPHWINELTDLEVLCLMNNPIEQDFDLSGLHKLISLYICMNKKLKHIPAQIYSLPNLSTLDFSFCSINEISDDILNCKTLKLVNGIGNKNLSKIPESVSTLPNLLSFTLDGTAIEENKRKEIKNSLRSKIRLVSA